jgi:glycosyltransferase involved in cell wall biosynthesis
LIVLPQNDDLLAQTQMPCKVFEAMAMAKPIIASSVADLPKVLAGCGWTVPPGDVDALARQIQWVSTHPREAAEFGRLAREICAEKYSHSVVAKQLHALVANVLS